MTSSALSAVAEESEFKRRGLLLVSAAIGLSAGMTATMFYSLGAFIPHLQAQFGWSRGDISLGVTFMTVALFLTGTYAGRLCDRYGAALIGAFSLAAYALGIVALVLFVTRIQEFWIAYAVIAVVGIGSTPIVLVRPISAVFDRHRGLALGIILTGAGLAGFWVPRVVAEVAQSHGWRAAYLVLAIVAMLTAPLVWFGFRSVPALREQSIRKRTAETGLDVQQARRTSEYWVLSVMALAMATGIAGIIVHLIPLFRDLGAEPLVAAKIASLVGLASVVGRLVIGLLLDRFSAPRVSFAVLALAAFGIFLLWWGGLVYAYLAVLLLGLAAGAEIDLLAYLASRYFGQRHYGAIYGWLYSVFALGYGLSPFLTGLLRDRYASYNTALGVSAVLMSLAALAAVKLGPYRYGPRR